MSHALVHFVPYKIDAFEKDDGFYFHSKKQSRDIGPFFSLTELAAYLLGLARAVYTRELRHLVLVALGDRGQYEIQLQEDAYDNIAVLLIDKSNPETTRTVQLGSTAGSTDAIRNPEDGIPV